MNKEDLILEKLDRIENTLIDIANKDASLLSMQEASEYLSLDYTTFTRQVKKGMWPVCRLEGRKRVYLKKSELDVALKRISGEELSAL